LKAGNCRVDLILLICRKIKGAAVFSLAFLLVFPAISPLFYENSILKSKYIFIALQDLGTLKVKNAGRRIEHEHSINKYAGTAQVVDKRGG
jgi:hypothetical protein